MILRFRNSFLSFETGVRTWLTTHKLSLFASKRTLRIIILTYLLLDILKYAYLYRLTLWLKIWLTKLL